MDRRRFYGGVAKAITALDNVSFDRPKAGLDKEEAEQVRRILFGILERNGYEFCQPDSPRIRKVKGVEAPPDPTRYDYKDEFQIDTNNYGGDTDIALRNNWLLDLLDCGQSPTFERIRELLTFEYGCSPVARVPTDTEISYALDELIGAGMVIRKKYTVV